jgi:uncharacterized membrane protein
MKPGATRLRGRSSVARKHDMTTTARPAWPIVALAGAGVAVAAYLTWTKFTAGHPVFCAPGSSCDVVQASRYAVLLGAPTAVWGAALAAVVGSLALSGLSPRRWLAAFLFAVAGVSFSAYLTYLAAAVIHAFCVYCLVSAGVWVALVPALVWCRPAAADRRSMLRLPRLVALGALSAAVTVAVGVTAFSEATPDSTGFDAALARHLTKAGAIMYGAYWCPHCAEQKTLFGAAARLLPYVECDPRGAQAQPQVCERADVRVYPTWVIAGRRFEGVQSLEQLAQLSGFRSGS